MQTALRNPRKVCSRIGFALATMLLLTVSSSLLLTVLALQFWPDLVYSQAGSWLLTDISIYLIGAPVYLLILHFIPDGQEAPRQPLRMSPGRFALLVIFCLGAAYITNMLTLVLVFMLELIQASSQSIATEFAEASLPVSIFFGCVIPAFGEEFLFRYQTRKKLRGAGDKIYILFSALCFAVFHMNVGQLFYTFVVGALLAWVYTQTDVIWYSVGLHFAFNLVGITISTQAENVPLLLAYMGVMLLLIIGAIIIFGLNRRWALRSLRAPDEPGWPYKAPPAVLPKNAPSLPVMPWQGVGLYGQPVPMGASYAPQPAYAMAYPTQAYPAAQMVYPYIHMPPVYASSQPFPLAAPQNTMSNIHTNSYSAYTNMQPGPGPATPGQAGGYGAPISSRPAELEYAGYTNMGQGCNPPSYQNMRPVWPGEHGAGQEGPTSAPAGMPPSPFGKAAAPVSAAKLCLVNPGMLLYLLGGLTVILLNLFL